MAIWHAYGTHETTQTHRRSRRPECSVHRRSQRNTWYAIVPSVRRRTDRNQPIQGRHEMGVLPLAHTQLVALLRACVRGASCVRRCAQHLNCLRAHTLTHTLSLSHSVVCALSDCHSTTVQLYHPSTLAPKVQSACRAKRPPTADPPSPSVTPLSPPRATPPRLPTFPLARSRTLHRPTPL